MRRTAFPRLIAFFLAMGASPLAHAADQPVADQIAFNEAKRIFTEGTKLMDAGDYLHAIFKFKAASVFGKSPNIEWDLAYSEFRADMYVPAMRDMRIYLHDPAAKPTYVQHATERFIPQMLRQVGDLHITAAKGATILIDGTAEPSSAPLPDPIAVAPGSHHVEAQLGADVVAKDVQVIAGQSIDIALLPPPAAVTLPPVSPVPASDPAPTTPAQPQQPDESAHASEKASPLRLGMTVGFGVAAAASLAGGIAFAVAAENKKNDAQNLQNGFTSSTCAGAGAPACSTVKSDDDSQNRDRTLAIVFYSGAGALAAGAVLSWVLLPKTVESRSAFAPMIGPGLAGARWAISF